MKIFGYRLVKESLIGQLEDEVAFYSEHYVEEQKKRREAESKLSDLQSVYTGALHQVNGLQNTVENCQKANDILMLEYARAVDETLKFQEVINDIIDLLRNFTRPKLDIPAHNDVVENP